jgi:hypothetical protein
MTSSSANYSTLVDTGDSGTRADLPQQQQGTLTTISEDESKQQQQQSGKSTIAPPTVGPGGRKLSIPFSEQRRKSSYGVYNRVVLCAVDMSQHSRDAFNWYLANIWKMDDLIVLCYCPEPPSMPSFSFKSGLTLPSEKWHDILIDANEKTRKLEEDFELTCIEKKLRYKIRGECYKNPGEGICKIAEDEAVNLIIMGSRGMSQLKRTFVGSVSEYVVRNSTIPCLVVPAGRC